MPAGYVRISLACVFVSCYRHWSCTNLARLKRRSEFFNIFYFLF